MKLQQRLHDRFGSGAPEISGFVDVPEPIASMLTHASCRSFSERPVDSGLVKLVLAAALSSPSKSDLQQVTIIWLADPDQRRAVLQLSSSNSWALSAPEAFVVCADGRRVRRLAARLGRDFPNNHLDQFMNATVDSGLVIGALVTAADALGLGTCPISELRDEAADLIRLLELPKYVVPIAGLALGWPQDPTRGLSPRLPFPVAVQENIYSDDPFDASWEEYEQLRDSVDGRRDEDQRDVKTFGIARPYGWAEDRTRQYSKPRRADWGSHVRNQGFGLD